MDLIIFLFLFYFHYIVGANQNNFEVSECSLEYLRGEDSEACSSMGEFYSKKKDVFIPSICPNQSPYINFNKKNSEQYNLTTPIYWRNSKRLHPYIRNIIKSTGLTITSNSSKDWIGVKKYHFKVNEDCPDIQANIFRKLHRMPGTELLCDKRKLGKLLAASLKKYGDQELPFHIQSFTLPRQIKEFKKAFENYEDKLWILKPPLGAGAVGVRLIKHWNELNKSKKWQFVVQKYISEPYLYKSRKIVSRIYVFITSLSPLRIYAAKDGRTFFAFQNYSAEPSQIYNHCIHIPVQSSSHGGGTGKCKNEESLRVSTWAQLSKEYTLTNIELFEHLKREGHNVSLLWDKLGEMVVKSVLIARPYLESKSKPCFPYTYNAYQELVFEFVLDKNLNLRMMEVNRYFSMQTNAAGASSVKSGVVMNSMTLAGFQPPPSFLAATGLPKSFSYGYKSNAQDDGTKYPVTKIDESMVDILENLTTEDVRNLVIAEDELGRSSGLIRLFPLRRHMEQYDKYFESPEHKHDFNLQKVWEEKFGNNRNEGIKFLHSKCSTIK